MKLKAIASDPAAQLNFEQLAKEVRRSACSAANVITWNGTALSNSLLVAHGLGVVPTVILPRINDIGQLVHIFATAKSDTTFTVQARAAAAVANGATTPFDWLVVA